MQMDERVIQQIQKEGADALLNVGVSVPLLDFKVPFRKVPLHIRVTMKRPTLAGQIKIARTYLSMETCAEQLCAMGTSEQMAFLAQHGKKLSKIIALTMPHWWVPTVLMSWIIRHFMKFEYQKAAISKFVSLMGTDPFIPIIRSVERTNPMKLRLSQKKKGS